MLRLTRLWRGSPGSRYDRFCWRVSRWFGFTNGEIPASWATPDAAAWRALFEAEATERKRLEATLCAAWAFRDYLARVEPVRFTIREDGSCPGCDAWNAFIGALESTRDVLGRPTHGRDCPCTPCRAEDWDAIERPA